MKSKLRAYGSMVSMNNLVSYNSIVLFIKFLVVFILPFSPMIENYGIPAFLETICRYYSLSLSIGHPPKVFEFDIDTGSDLTWVQCDAPCNGCTKVNL